MRPLILVVTSLLGICVFARATSGDDISSARLLNGHAWLDMTMLQKATYLRGVYDGVLQARYILAASKDKEADGQLAQVAIRTMTFRETVIALDGFYADTSNVAVPIVYAHEWLKHKVGGASRSELDDEAAKLRSIFSKERTSQ